MDANKLFFDLNPNYIKAGTIIRYNICKLQDYFQEIKVEDYKPKVTGDFFKLLDCRFIAKSNITNLIYIQDPFNGIVYVYKNIKL